MSQLGDIRRRLCYFANLGGAKSTYPYAPLTLPEDRLPCSVVSYDGSIPSTVRNHNNKLSIGSFSVTTYATKIDAGSTEDIFEKSEPFYRAVKSSYPENNLDISRDPLTLAILRSQIISDSGIIELSYKDAPNKYLGFVLTFQIEFIPL